MAGWIKIHRKIKDHWLWQDAEKLRWWFDLILEANHEDRKVLLKGALVECKRGECVKSLETWAKEWRTTRKTVRHFFGLLEKDGMINIKSVTVSTRVTICNYESYQDKGPDKDTQGIQQTTRQTTHKQELQEVKKVIPLADRVAEFERFWNAYGKKKDRYKCESKWSKLTNEERVLALERVGMYVAVTPDDRFRKDPLTWLNGKCWNDEMLTAHKRTKLVL